jgi:hypothetical protein
MSITRVILLAGIALNFALPVLAQTPEAALSKLSPENRAWVTRSCPRTLGPSLWSNCIIRESAAAAAGKPDLSMLKPEFQSWVVRSCPDTLGPSLTISCLNREKSALVAGLPDISSLTEEQKQWVLKSCPTSLGPSLFKSCLEREAGALRGTRSVPQQPPSLSPPAQSFPRARSRRTRPNSYPIEVAHDDELFIINGEKFEAQTYCLGWEEGDEVIFLEGSPFGACASAKLLNLRTRETCDVWCE